MPQTFPPRSNLISKASIIALLVLGVVITGALAWYFHTPTFTQVGVTVPQPVPFPHIIHITSVGMNCRYCHAGVDQSSFADLPPSETCMTCHSQIATDRASLEPVRQSWKTGTPIQWNRVNKVPDFVYFDHHIHISKGVGCETCHGRVDQMTTDVKANTFYMAWCLDCHRDPAKYLRPRDQVYTMGYKPAGDQLAIGRNLVKEYDVMNTSQLINCYTCHR